MKQNLPYGLDGWLELLKHKKFPVNGANLTRLKNQIKTPDATLDRLQENITSEPMMAFVILSEANRIVSNKRTDIKTPTHAASMVGMNGLSKIIPKLEAYEFSRKNLAHQHFRRQVQISYEAASIARRWAIEKRSSNPDDVFWITFFRDAVRWLMWFHASEAMLLMVSKLEQGASTKIAEQESLGCRLDELAVKLFQVWQIPHIIINSFLTDHIPTPQELQMLASLAPDPDQIPGYTEDKRLTIIANNPLLLSFCATKVAHDANNKGWGAKSLLFYYQVIACVLHCRQGKVIQTTHLAAAESANHHVYSDKFPIACELLSPTLYIESQTNNAPRRQPKTTPLDWLKQRCLTSPLDRKQLLKETLKTIKAAIPNTQHSIIFYHSAKQARLAAVAQFGYDLEVVQKIQWNTPSSTFSTLKAKAALVDVPSPKLSRFIKTLPQSSQDIIDEHGHLLLASIPYGKDCVILWLETREQFSTDDISTIKSLLAIISKAFKLN